jgi:PEP-CTERM motif
MKLAITIALALGLALALVAGAALADPLAPTAVVPEPSTWAMMLLGFAGLGFAFRQSRRKVSFA